MGKPGNLYLCRSSQIPCRDQGSMGNSGAGRQSRRAAQRRRTERLLTNDQNQTKPIPGPCYSQTPMQWDGWSPGICICNTLSQVPWQALKFRKRWLSLIFWFECVQLPFKAKLNKITIRKLEIMHSNHTHR